MAKWTTQQKRAIDEDTNLLVNAAAGSGKTAVLVERITKKLIPDIKGQYIDADSLLVVTFARDAAHEMQDRIKKSLLTLLSETDDKKLKAVLRTQLKKLPFADIATIDSFCMKLVKSNFHLLGIDPKFGIMDPSEGKVYTFECMDEYFKMLYDEKNPDMELLTKIYSTGYTDREISETVYEIYSFTRSLANPDEWIQSHVEDYRKFDGSKIQKIYKNKAILLAKASEDRISAIMDMYKKDVGSDNEEELHLYGKIDLWSVFEKDITLLKSIQNADFENIQFDVVDKKKIAGKADCVPVQKSYVDMRKSVITEMEKALEPLRKPVEETDRYYNDVLYPHAKALANIVCGFSEFHYEKKLKDGKLEFNDLEHMSIKLLTEFEDIRNSLKNKYSEILMDEYQDTNDLQEKIFSLISKGDNRFIVGDLKQSIYRFRQSDPSIFIEKDNLYKNNANEGTRIVLSKNFRSRKNVLDSINYLFYDIMTKETGEVDYDEDQALYYGNSDFDKEADGASYASELYVIEGTPKSENDDEESYSDVELEAEFVASKIREMIDGKYQILRKDGTFSDAKETDFAILMNAVSTSGEVFAETLGKYGIGSYCEDKGFFERTEVRLVLEFVRTVNNPFRDIHLISVMRSPVYRFTDDNLAEIRLCAKDRFWDAVRSAAAGEGSLARKCSDFVKDIESWRNMSLYMTADRLIWRIIHDTSLYDMCGILYGGEMAQANLRLFVERARVLSDDGIATLFDYEQYVVRMLNSDGIGGAGKNGGGVAIMTIHKSKGLEFPVVFVSGTGKSFVNANYGSRIYMHKDFGFGINGVDIEKSCAVSSINKRFIAGIKEGEAGAEQLRKLYVALTRAKEKLIVTGVVHSSKDKGAFDFTDSDVTVSYINSCKNYITMTAPTVKKCTDKSLWEYHEIPYSHKEDDTDTVAENVEIDETESTDNIRDAVFSILDKFDSVRKPVAVQTKVSVSSLKNKSEYAAKLRHVPDFMRKESHSGAEFGTSVHEVMEKIVYTDDMNREYIKCEIERISGDASGILDKVYGFFSSDLGKRCVKNNAKREQEFETTIVLDGESTLLQGIIDCYFEENGQVVLVDYKTDVCSDINELRDKYSEQLKWYKYAIEKILGKNVSETYIYSFHKNDFLMLEWSDNSELAE